MWYILKGILKRMAFQYKGNLVYFSVIFRCDIHNRNSLACPVASVVFSIIHLYVNLSNLYGILCNKNFYHRVSHFWYPVYSTVEWCEWWLVYHLSRGWSAHIYDHGGRRHFSLQWCHYGRNNLSNHQPHHCLLNHLFRRRSKKTSKLRVAGLCEGNSPVTGEFPAQIASNAENLMTSSW